MVVVVVVVVVVIVAVGVREEATVGDGCGGAVDTSGVSYQHL